uniref:Signal peptide protein n=1 Tax=Heterorhabditis bacteriophora TaxID=37862 RepID=A0A1I7WAZ5_HETBA
MLPWTGFIHSIKCPSTSTRINSVMFNVIALFLSSEYVNLNFMVPLLMNLVLLVAFILPYTYKRDRRFFNIKFYFEIQPTWFGLKARSMKGTICVKLYILIVFDIGSFLPVRHISLFLVIRCFNNSDLCLLNYLQRRFKFLKIKTNSLFFSFKILRNQGTIHIFAIKESDESANKRGILHKVCFKFQIFIYIHLIIKNHVFCHVASSRVDFYAVPLICDVFLIHFFLFSRLLLSVMMVPITGEQNQLFLFFAFSTVLVLGFHLVLMEQQNHFEFMLHFLSLVLKVIINIISLDTMYKYFLVLCFRIFLILILNQIRKNTHMAPVNGIKQITQVLLLISIVLFILVLQLFYRIYRYLIACLSANMCLNLTDITADGITPGNSQLVHIVDVKRDHWASEGSQTSNKKDEECRVSNYPVCYIANHLTVIFGNWIKLMFYFELNFRICTFFIIILVFQFVINVYLNKLLFKIIVGLHHILFNYRSYGVKLFLSTCGMVNIKGNIFIYITPSMSKASCGALECFPAFQVPSFEQYHRVSPYYHLKILCSLVLRIPIQQQNMKRRDEMSFSVEKYEIFPGDEGIGISECQLSIYILL